MKTLYLECTMGAAGDMLTAALLELLPDRDAFISRINSAGIPGVHVTAEQVIKCGVAGTHVAVTVHGEEEESCDETGHNSGSVSPHKHEHTHHDHSNKTGHEHHHSSPSDIKYLVEQLQVSSKVKTNIRSVYQLIAEAESHAHNMPVEEIHFHEVGTMDALADITGVCLLMEILAPDRVIVSPVHVGAGEVRCAHGILPVPAPATAFILRGIPIYGGSVQGELCTPTGAALLKFFADEFGPMPEFRVETIGYGMGRKDFEQANCLRAYWGTAETTIPSSNICELSCNLDDMTPEALGFAQEILFKNGALDVFTIPIGMKKCRPGILLTCICKRDTAEKLSQLIFLHTSTIGIRRYDCQRYTLERSEKTVQTAAGPVRIKTSRGYGVTKIKQEYEDIVCIARERNIPFSEALKFAESAE